MTVLYEFTDDKGKPCRLVRHDDEEVIHTIEEYSATLQKWQLVPGAALVLEEAALVLSLLKEREELREALGVIHDQNWAAMIEACPKNSRGNYWEVADFHWCGDHYEDADCTLPYRMEILRQYAEAVLLAKTEVLAKGGER